MKEIPMNNYKCNLSVDTLESRSLLSGMSLTYDLHHLIVPQAHCKSTPALVCKPVYNQSILHSKLYCKYNHIAPQVCKPVAPPVCKPVAPPHCKPVPPPVCKPGHDHIGSPVCSQVPKISMQNGVVTITEGNSKVVLNGETVTIVGKGCGTNVNQIWYGDVHVKDNIAGTNTEEQLPVARLSNMTVAGFCSALNTQLEDTIIIGDGWYVAYDNATSQIIAESI